MAFEKIETPKSWSRRPGCSGCPARFFFPAASKHKSWAFATFYVRSESISDLRWILGDRVDFFFDKETKRVGVKRTSGGASMVSSSHKKKQYDSVYKMHCSRTLTELLKKEWGVQAGVSSTVECSISIDGDMLILEKTKLKELK